MPDTRTALALPDLATARFIDSSTTRRRVVTELHLTGPMSLLELVRSTGRSPWRLRRQLRALASRGLVVTVSMDRRPRLNDVRDLYALRG